MCFTCVACLLFRLNNKSFYAKISSSVLKMAGGVKQIFARTPNDKSNVWAWNLWKIPEVALEKSSCLNVEIIKLCEQGANRLRERHVTSPLETLNKFLI